VTAEMYREELTRYAFVNGLASSAIRQRLLGNDEISLNQAFELAVNLDRAHRYSGCMGHLVPDQSLSMMTSDSTAKNSGAATYTVDHLLQLLKLYRASSVVWTLTETDRSRNFFQPVHCLPPYWEQPVRMVQTKHLANHSIVVARSQRQRAPTEHWLLPGNWRGGRCSSGRSWWRARWRENDESSVPEDTVSDSVPALPRRSTRGRKPPNRCSFNVASNWMGEIVEIGVLLHRRLNVFIAKRWLLPRQIGAVGVCISWRVLSGPSCCCRDYVFLTLLFVSADGNCDFMLILKPSVLESLHRFLVSQCAQMELQTRLIIALM